MKYLNVLTDLYQRRWILTVSVSVLVTVGSILYLSPFVVQGAIGSDFSFVAGIPNSCSGTGSLSIPVIANVTDTDSSQGSLFIQGVGNVSGPSNNPNGLISGPTIYVYPLASAYSVPAHTPITATITVFSGLNFTGSAITHSLTWDCTTGGAVAAVAASGLHQCGITDGRLNCWPEMEAHPFAVYCDAGTVVIYAIDQQGVGTLAFKVSQAQLDVLDPKPSVNTLIKQNLGVALYRLSSGKLQVNGRNDTFFIWNNC